MTFDKWFQSQQGIPYDSYYLFSKAAWEHQEGVIVELMVNNKALNDVISYEKSRSAALQALCDQLGNAMELHGSPFLHHELRYEEALAAWRASK